MRASRGLVEEVTRRGSASYGIRTGLGKLATVAIPPEDILRLQVNILRSHAAGVGPDLPEDLARALLLARANGLTKGLSGIRPGVVETLVEFLNRRLTPLVPSQGSVGTSGDLQPLAHVGLCLIGEGRAMVRGRALEGGKALRAVGLKPVELEAKEALAIINGTSLTAAYGALGVEDAADLVRNAVLASSMSFEALRATPRAYDPKVHAARPYRGQGAVAKVMRDLLRGSEVVESHRDEKADPRVQDAYTLRCIPQVVGAVVDVLQYVRGVVEVDLNAATDNPLVFPREGDVISGGNFHGQPLAMALDFLGLSLTVLGGFAERRIARLVDPHLSDLPPFLTEEGGLNSGFMIGQYTAAALASENKLLSHPASADSIPTSANQEDYVCMGPAAGQKLLRIIENVRNIIAIEFLCAAQGLEFIKPLRPGAGPEAAYGAVRAIVPRLKGDRPLSPDIAGVAKAIKEGRLVGAAARRVPSLAALGGGARRTRTRAAPGR
jgi:histidine ammonia-lyase